MPSFSLYSNYILGSSSEAINVVASSPGNELCSFRKTLSFERKFIDPFYRYICGASCNFVFAEFLHPSVASVQPGEDLYLVLWIGVFHSVEVNFISSGLSVWTA